MADIIDLATGKRIVVGDPKGTFHLAARCPDCDAPIFVHETYENKDVPTAFFATCDHNPSVTAEYPPNDDLVYEREAIKMFLTLYWMVVGMARQLAEDNDRLEALAAKQETPTT